MATSEKTTLSKEQRHKNMAAIHSKDTKPEMIVRKGLWSRGFRYRLNSPRLPGASGSGAEEVSDMYLCEWVLWAWAQCGVAKLRMESLELRTRSVVRFRRRTGSSGWRRFGETRSGISKS